jgi:hypothetical protein
MRLHDTARARPRLRHLRPSAPACERQPFGVVRWMPAEDVERSRGPVRVHPLKEPDGIHVPRIALPVRSMGREPSAHHRRRRIDALDSRVREPEQVGITFGLRSGGPEVRDVRLVPDLVGVDVHARVTSYRSPHEVRVVHEICGGVTGRCAVRPCPRRRVQDRREDPHAAGSHRFDGRRCCGGAQRERKRGDADPSEYRSRSNDLRPQMGHPPTASRVALAPMTIPAGRFEPEERLRQAAGAGE